MSFRGRFVCAVILAAAVACGLSGCASNATAAQGVRYSRPGIPSGKSPSQVAPCCQDLAAGRIALDQCMRKPECRANDNRCCMNAI